MHAWVSSIDKGDDRDELIVGDLSWNGSDGVLRFDIIVPLSDGMLRFDIVPLSDGMLRFDIVHASFVKTSEAVRFDMVLEYSPPEDYGSGWQCHWPLGTLGRCVVGAC